VLSRPNGRFHHLRPGRSRAHGRGHRGLGSPCLFCMRALLGLEVQSKVSGQVTFVGQKMPFSRDAGRGSLITIWLEVRILPGPPRSPIRTGVSWSLANSAHFAGVSAGSRTGCAVSAARRGRDSLDFGSRSLGSPNPFLAPAGVALEDRRGQIDKPSIAYWHHHSAGASRRRVTPMPRGSRPSTAAFTSSGARNASETCARGSGSCT
jgi:hypothetical protein